MTNEEAIKNIKELLKWYLKEEPMSETVYKREAVEMAIKALEQQPCEECISRQDVDAYIAKLMSGYLYDEERTRLEELSAYLWELPSVTPQRPKGKWIGSNGVNYTYPNSFTICSVCKCHSDKFYKYCPNCGADMSGGKEDGDSN